MTDFLGGRFVRWMTSSTARAGRLGLSAARLGATAFLRTVGRLVGAEVIADTIEFLSAFEGMYDGFRNRAAAVEALLRSSECRFVIVTAPATGSLEEAGFFLDRLAEASMGRPCVVVNRWHPADHSLPPDADRAIAALQASKDAADRAVASLLAITADRVSAHGAEVSATAGFLHDHRTAELVIVPELDGDVHDVPGLRRVAEQLFEG